MGVVACPPQKSLKVHYLSHFGSDLLISFNSFEEGLDEQIKKLMHIYSILTNRCYPIKLRKDLLLLRSMGI